MLYCSNDRNTVFFEMKATKGIRLAIIHYETTCPLTVNRIGFTLETFRALDAARAIPDYGRLELEKYTELDHLINDFLSEVFCQQVTEAESYRYKVSAAVAEKLLGENPEPMQGLMYPTVPMWANADNFAFGMLAAMLMVAMEQRSVSEQISRRVRLFSAVGICVSLAASHATGQSGPLTPPVTASPRDRHWSASKPWLAAMPTSWLATWAGRSSFLARVSVAW